MCINNVTHTERGSSGSLFFLASLYPQSKKGEILHFLH